MNSREMILDLLMELSRGKEYSNILLAAVLDKYDYLEPREKAFIKRVTEGTIERRIQIDYLLSYYSKVPVAKMKPLIRELLRMSVYQILFTEKIPDSAVCNEAVKLAGKRHFQNLRGYVNGVLRNLARHKDELPCPDRAKEPLTYLSVLYSMPEWLVEHFQSLYGAEMAEKILQSFLERKPVCVRVKEQLAQEKREEMLSAWTNAGVRVEKHPYLSYAFLLDGADGISRLYGYREGLFAVQDVSSMLVVECADITKDSVVLDVCAAPGGKTTHAASRLRGSGEVIACDVSTYKTDKIRENCERLGYPDVQIRVQDAREHVEEFTDRADVVLADVPCSGLGVIGKKQDIKYRITQEDLVQITKLQKEILRNVVQYVKPGGTLLYSTCTINPAENEEMVRWICEQFPFEEVSVEAFLPKGLTRVSDVGMQFLPGVHETDGFFIAKLRRNGD